VFFIRKLRLLTWRGGSGPKIALVEAKVQPEPGITKGRQGTSTRKDLRVLCYEHHTEMLLECRSEPAETFPYACREAGCFIRYISSQGYFIEPSQDGDRSEPEIRPGVHCPKDGRLMYLAEVRPETKSFRLWKCPECNAVRTNGELSSTAASSA
jgi:hypothetical protein